VTDRDGSDNKQVKRQSTSMNKSYSQQDHWVITRDSIYRYGVAYIGSLLLLRLKPYTLAVPYIITCVSGVVT